MSKAIMFCGRDNGGIVRPINVLEDGSVKLPYSHVEDDNGDRVLRVVDAAPYLVEYGMYDTAVNSKHVVPPAATKVLEENANRKFVSVYNRGSAFLALSAGDEGSESGIIIAPNERYEMSVLRGNLYRGAMHLCTLDEKAQKITAFSQGGIGNGGFSDSTNRTHTDYIPVDVSEQGLCVAVSVESSVAAIRNVAAFDENKQLVTYNPDIVASFPVYDGEYHSASFVLTNKAVKYIAVSFCRAGYTSTALSVDAMSGTVLTIKKALPSTAYIVEGE